MKPKMVIVDDDVLVGRSFGRLMREHYDVTTFTNPLDALAYLESDARVDVILSDVCMGSMTGADLFQRLSLELQKRVVFMSGGYPAELKAIIESRLFLPKPFDVDDALETFAKLAA